MKQHKRTEEPRTEALRKDVAVQVDAWQECDRPERDRFPGPPGAQAALRVAMDRSAYAELVAHAKESLDKEVCGVLVGGVCEDDAGVFVRIRTVIRGAMARQANTKVTFTQETWNHIHDVLRQEHPQEKIIGWYHTHPGYGVTFSDMDLFIHRNFFSGPTQVALVTDPLNGETAVCRNGEDGIRYLDRFWVDGREHRLQVPAGVVGAADGSGSTDAGTGAADRRLADMEMRLGQLVQAVDEQAAAVSRALLTVYIVVGMAVVFLIGFNIYRHLSERFTPPEAKYVSVPVQVGDRQVCLGILAAQWEVPPEMNAAYLQLQREQLAMLEQQLLAQRRSQAPVDPKTSWFGRAKSWARGLFGRSPATVSVAGTNAPPANSKGSGRQPILEGSPP